MSCKKCPYFNPWTTFKKNWDTKPGVVDVLFVFDYPTSETWAFSDLGLFGPYIIKERLKDLTKDKRFNYDYIFSTICTSETPKAAQLDECLNRRITNLILRANPLLIVVFGRTALRSLGTKTQFLHVKGKVIDLKIGPKKYKVGVTLSWREVLKGGKDTNKWEVIKQHISSFLKQIEKVDFRELTEDYILPLTPEDTINALEWLANQSFLNNPLTYMAVDIETNSLKAFLPDSKIIAISFGWTKKSDLPKGKAMAVLVDHPKFSPSPREREKILDLINRILSSPIRKVFQNVKFDYSFLKLKYRLDLKHVGWDTQYAEHLINENIKGYYRLEELAGRYYPEFAGYKGKVLPGVFTVEEAQKKGKEVDFTAEKIEDLLYYAAMDADITRRVIIKQYPLLTKKQRELLTNLIIPVSFVLAEMEYKGCPLDSEKVNHALQLTKERQAYVLNRLRELAGPNFDPNKTAHIRKYVQDHYPTSLFKRTQKTGEISVDKKALEFLQEKYNCEFSSLILEYRKLHKAGENYVSTFKEHLDKYGALHGEFVITGTATGRLASKNPNLQNIPKKEGDIEIKSLIVPPKGYLIVDADAKGAELRVLTLYARDKTMIETINSGRDIHSTVASLLFNKPYEWFANRDNLPDPEKDEATNLRRKAKSVVFGIIYGITPQGLSNNIGVSVEEAQELINNFLDQFPEVRNYIEETKEEVRSKQYVETIFGRRRRFPILFPKSFLYEAYRQAVNFKIQSTTSDMVLYQLVNINPIIKELGGFPILTVHDSIVFCVPEGKIDSIESIFLEFGTKWIAKKVPELLVEFKWDIDIKEHY